MQKTMGVTFDLKATDLVNELNKAYRDEMILWNRAEYLCGSIKKPGCSKLCMVLRKVADDDKAHAEELAGVIKELGGRPAIGPADLENDLALSVLAKDSCGSDYFRTVNYFKAALIRTIEIYRKLAASTVMADRVTYDLIQFILVEESEHLEMFEGLIV